MNKGILAVVIALAIALSFPPTKEVVADFPSTSVDVAEIEAELAFKEVVEQTLSVSGCQCGGTKVEKHDGVSPSPCRCLSSGECKCSRNFPKEEVGRPFEANVVPVKISRRSLVYFTQDNCPPCREQERIFKEMAKSGWIFTQDPNAANHFVVTKDRAYLSLLKIESVPAFVVIESDTLLTAPAYGLKTQEEVVKYYYENRPK